MFNDADGKATARNVMVAVLWLSERRGNPSTERISIRILGSAVWVLGV